MSEDPEVQLQVYKRKLAEAQGQLAEQEKRLSEFLAAEAKLQAMSNSYKEAIRQLASRVSCLDHGNTICLKSAIRKVEEELTGSRDIAFSRAIEQDLADATHRIQALRNEIELTSGTIGQLSQTIAIYTTLLSN